MASYFTGDTIRLVGTFRDWAASGSTGSLIDPDTIQVMIVEKDTNTEVVAWTDAARESKGVYYYDFELPATANTFVVTFRGTVNSEDATPYAFPVLSRMLVESVDLKC